MMKRLLLLTLLAACEKDPVMTGPDMAMSLIPSAPMLGAAIDRMGRPAINTALNNTFNDDDAQKSIAKDAYNTEGNQANWFTMEVEGKLLTKEFAGNLAVIDALDGVCGNQLMALGDSTGDAGAAEYAALPTVLVDDELYLDTSIGDCKPVTTVGSLALPNYLAVEARFLGLPLATCGGRTPLDDVIDVTYTLLAAGASGTVVSDGIDADDAATPPSLSAFPFLNSPN
jgi:hypothetical protein